MMKHIVESNLLVMAFYSYILLVIMCSPVTRGNESTHKAVNKSVVDVIEEEILQLQCSRELRRSVKEMMLNGTTYSSQSKLEF